MTKQITAPAAGLEELAPYFERIGKKLRPGYERTARSYMQIARAPLEERQRVADLPLREALAAIARPCRYRLDCCDTPVLCNCGADYVVIVDGEVVARMPVRPIDGEGQEEKKPS